MCRKKYQCSGKRIVTISCQGIVKYLRSIVKVDKKKNINIMIYLLQIVTRHYGTSLKQSL